MANIALASLTQAQAIEALRRNLLYAMLNGVSEKDMSDVVKAQVKKAKKGDSKAAKLIMDMTAASGTGMSIRQNVILADGAITNWRLEARKIVACFINFCGPQQTEEIASRLHLSGEGVMEVLQCDWFTRDGDKWCLTSAARQHVLDQPAKLCAEASK